MGESRTQTYFQKGFNLKEVVPERRPLLPKLVLVAVPVAVGLSVGPVYGTVSLAMFEVTPPALAVAVLVTEPAATSARVTVYVAVQVMDSTGSPGSRKASRSPTVLTSGQTSLVDLSSLTVTGPASGADPLLVTT